MLERQNALEQYNAGAVSILKDNCGKAGVPAIDLGWRFERSGKSGFGYIFSLRGYWFGSTGSVNYTG